MEWHSGTMYPVDRMRAGLSTRIFLGFLVLLLVFAGASALAVRRMHAIREDLVIIHRGYLALARGSTQARALQEAREATVARALATPDPAVRRQLLASGREVGQGGELVEHLDELEALTRQLLVGRARPVDHAFLERVLAECSTARTASGAYDDATTRLADGADDAAEAALLADEQRHAGEVLSELLRSLGAGIDGKVSEAVLRAERDEREAAFAVVALTVVAALVGVLVVFATIRTLRPLRALVESAKAIGRGSLDVQVAVPADDEVGALAREFNAMAKALKDREAVLASRGDELLRMSGFAENVIRSVRVGILVIDEQGRVRTLNPGARSVFKLPLVDVDGRRLAELIDEGLREPLAPLLQGLDTVRGTGEPMAFPLLRLSDKVVDVGLVPIRDRAGASQPDVLVLAEDVTSREETAERLLQTERFAAIGRLAAQITHEIRNPLSSVGLNIELLGDDLAHLPPERHREAKAILDAVGKEVDRLTQITEGYLRFARLPAPKKVAGDAGDLLADLVAFTQADATKAGVMLELNVEPGLPHVPFEPARLRQALLNLVRNAVEAAGTGGTVRVSAKKTAGGLRVTVEDTGPGIPEEVRARLFEPFFTTKPSGTGLGLLLAKEIILEHQGELSVETSALGGAAFQVDLPAQPEVAAPPPPE
jgi:PAS domain S-box-containing protein